MQSSGLKVKTVWSLDEIGQCHAIAKYYSFFPSDSYGEVLSGLKQQRPELSEDQCKRTASELIGTFNSTPCRFARLHDGSDTVCVLLSLLYPAPL